MKKAYDYIRISDDDQSHFSIDGQKKMNALVQDWTKNAPAGSDAAVQVMKHAIASAGNVFETSQKAVKHAVEVAQSNLSSATDTVMKSAQSENKAAKKK